MIRVTVKISTTLREYVPQYNPEIPFEVEIEEGNLVSDLAIKLNIPINEIKIVMVNGCQSEIDTLLRDRDRVAYFPAVGGG